MIDKTYLASPHEIEYLDMLRSRALLWIPISAGTGQMLFSFILGNSTEAKWGFLLATVTFALWFWAERKARLIVHNIKERPITTTK